MAACLDVQTWRISTPNEVLAFMDPDRKDRSKRYTLAIRAHLRPVDVYTYLKARFGKPNGFQNFLRRDDSDNLIHWDFNVRAGNEDVYLCGTSREVHVTLTEQLSDEEWKKLIFAIKSDFARIAKDKSVVLHSLEKYVLFQNKYVALADLCAELHASISGAPPAMDVGALTKDTSAAFKKAMGQRSRRMVKLFGNCLKLRLLMPVMAESYINMLILTFCRSVIRDDRKLYEGYLRTTIPERVGLLSVNCDGFRRAVDKTLPGWETFMRIMNRRNFELHGNVEPMREQIEVVYFDGRRPLFVNPGHNIHLRFEQVEREANPEELLQEYEGLHGFLADMADCLTPTHKAFFEQVISDAYPGFEVNKRRPTRLLPDHLIWHTLEGLRYDDELIVQW